MFNLSSICINEITNGFDLFFSLSLSSHIARDVNIFFCSLFHAFALHRPVGCINVYTIAVTPYFCIYNLFYQIITLCWYARIVRQYVVTARGAEWSHFLDISSGYILQLAQIIIINIRSLIHITLCFSLTCKKWLSG